MTLIITSLSGFGSMDQGGMFYIYYFLGLDEPTKAIRTSVKKMMGDLWGEGPLCLEEAMSLSLGDCD